MNTNLYTSVIFVFLFTIIGAIFPAQAKGQNSLNTVRIVNVKPDKLSDFLELQREYRETRIKAGKQARHVWREIRGKGDVFHIVTNAKSYADFDEPWDPGMEEGKWANWDRRIRKTIDSYEVTTLRAYGDLKIDRANEEIPPKFIDLRYRTFAPGHKPPYKSWLTSTFFPRMRENGAVGVFAQKMEFGGSGTTWLLSFYFDSWGELNHTAAWGKMSAKEHEEFFAPVRPAHAKNTILSYMPGLSNFGPEAYAK